jgi:hypothetical protein
MDQLFALISEQMENSQLEIGLTKEQLILLIDVTTTGIVQLVTFSTMLDDENKERLKYFDKQFDNAKELMNVLALAVKGLMFGSNRLNKGE